jgi:hypothetical protein
MGELGTFVLGLILGAVAFFGVAIGTCLFISRNGDVGTGIVAGLVGGIVAGVGVAYGVAKAFRR